MYKTELVRKVAQETRLSRRIVGDVLAESLAAITESLRRGQPVVLPGFGTFYTKERPAGSVRHIRSGELITIPAMPQADFRVGELLRQAVRKQRPSRRRGRLANGETND